MFAAANFFVDIRDLVLNAFSYLVFSFNYLKQITLKSHKTSKCLYKGRNAYLSTILIHTQREKVSVKFDVPTLYGQKQFKIFVLCLRALIKRISEDGIRSGTYLFSVCI